MLPIHLLSTELLEVLACLVEAHLVRTAAIIMVPELNGIILPVADWANPIGTAWLLSERQVATARTWISYRTWLTHLSRSLIQEVCYPVVRFEHCPRNAFRSRNSEGIRRWIIVQDITVRLYIRQGPVRWIADELVRSLDIVVYTLQLGELCGRHLHMSTVLGCPA